MKKILTVAVLSAALFSTNSVMAQKGAWDIGARGGVNISKLCCGSMTINEDYKFGEGPMFGVTASYGLSKNFSLVAELDYTTQGGKKNGMQAVTPGSNGSIFYADFKNKTVLNYLELPVMARYTLGDKIKYYVNAGPYIGYLLSAKQVSSGSSKLYKDAAGSKPDGTITVNFDADKDISSQVKDINFGLQGGLGAGYTFGQHGIWLDGRYVLGATNIRENTAVNGENSTGSIMAALGYTYRLSK
jgi:hypothetical protein